jgi:hypothetical protein
MSSEVQEVRENTSSFKYQTTTGMIEKKYSKLCSWDFTAGDVFNPQQNVSQQKASNRLFAYCSMIWSLQLSKKRSSAMKKLANEDRFSRWKFDRTRNSLQF